MADFRINRRKAHQLPTDLTGEEEEFGLAIPFNPVAPFALTTKVAEDVVEQVEAVSPQALESWLMTLCTNFTMRDSGEVSAWLNMAADPAKTLATNVIAIFKRSESIELAQAHLFDLVGESGLDFIGQLLERFEEISQLEPQSLAPSSSVSMSEKCNMSELQYDSLSANQKRKLARREQRELERAIAESSQTVASGDWLQQVGFDEEYLREERLLGLQKNRNLQNWTENLAPEGTLEAYEKRSSLPAGATKTMGQGFEEITVPAAKRLPPPQEGELISISSLLPWAQKAFPDTKQLNRLQSAVFNCAFNSAENMLVCAPTGAGKLVFNF